MALSNLSQWSENKAVSACGSACGASDNPAETPTACGAFDNPAETPTACGASDKPDETPTACGSACGASDK